MSVQSQDDPDSLRPRRKHHLEELDFQQEASNLLRVRQGLSQKFPEVPGWKNDPWLPGKMMEIAIDDSQECIYVVLHKHT